MPQAGSLSLEQRAKLSAAHRGKPLSVEHRARISEGRRGKPLSLEHRAAISAAKKGKSFSLEHRANISAARKGKRLSLEHRATLSSVRRGKRRAPLSIEWRAKISAAKRGKKYVPFVVKGRTKPELAMADILRLAGVDFVEQYKIPDQNITVDFYVPPSNLVIEVDGEYWHTRPGRKKRDACRDVRLKAAGYHVQRVLAPNKGRLTYEWTQKRGR